MKKWFLVLGSVVPIIVAIIASIGLALTTFWLGGFYGFTAPAMSSLADAGALLFVFGGLICLSSVLFAVVACWVLYDLVTGDHVAADKRPMWIAGWVFVNAVVVIAYIYLFVWKTEEATI